ncbi:MAG: DotU family type IV/VI secretion system protein [Deltaproteobacteria bacterium]|jgi:hypothetical protein|nr:DotU family type IV/VI secretion system protein [Deltaproteobacteria bacterium]
MRFASRFFRIFSLALEAAGDERRWPDWTTVSGELSALLADERRLPLPPGFGPAERREALWPVLAWVDETFLNSRRRDAAQWYDHSLQRSLLDTNIGGELFYRRLRALLDLRRRHLPDGPEGALSALRLELDRGGPAASGAPEGRGREAGGEQDSGQDEASDYLPESFYMEEAPETAGREVAAADLCGLWVSPGDGPEPLESVLDTYAMCIILGFKGQFSPRGTAVAVAPSPARAAPMPGGAAGTPELAAVPESPDRGDSGGKSLSDPSEDRELLKACARQQMRSWSSKGGRPPEKRRKRGIFGRLADFWRDYDWVVYHIIIPLLALGAFYYHGAAIIENLPF